MKKNDFNYDIESFLNFKKTSSPKQMAFNPNPPPPIVDRNVLIREKLESAMELAKKKLKTDDDLEVFRHITLNNRTRIVGTQMKSLKKDSERLLNLIHLHILDKDPIKYPSPNVGYIKTKTSKARVNLDLIKTYALANDAQKILELLEAPTKKTIKYELFQAIKNENLEQMFHWFEKLRVILSK